MNFQEPTTTIMKTLLPLLLLGVASLHARPVPIIGEMAEEVLEKTLFLNPQFLVYPPTKTEPDQKIPLLIYLHGAGCLGSEIRKITGQSRGVVEGIQRFEKGPCLVVAPQCRRESEKSDLRGTWEPKDLDLFLAHLLEHYDYIDPDRIYLTGNSMGGYGSWVWGGNSPEHFAAIAPVSGGIGRGGPKDVSPDIEKWAANLAKVPVYAFAGAKDRVVPAERSERIVTAIKKAGGKQAKLTIYPEEAHGAGRQVFSNKPFYDWMFSQKRNSK